MSTATSGRAREYLVRDALDAAGYAPIMRAAASKGAADLLHGHPFTGALLVQVGTANKSLNREGRYRLCAAADLCHGTPILATVIQQRGKRTEIRYWRVTREVPSKWDEWTP